MKPEEEVGLRWKDLRIPGRAGTKEEKPSGSCLAIALSPCQPSARIPETLQMSWGQSCVSQKEGGGQPFGLEDCGDSHRRQLALGPTLHAVPVQGTPSPWTQGWR